MSRFRGTACDQCKAEGKHPGHGLPDAPLPGWHRITHESGAAYDFCSIKCAIDWLKERKRQQAARAKDVPPIPPMLRPPGKRSQ